MSASSVLLGKGKGIIFISFFLRHQRHCVWGPQSPLLHVPGPPHDMTVLPVRGPLEHRAFLIGKVLLKEA